MCGLAGVLTRHPDQIENLGEDVDRMTGALVHRGPDDQGLWIDRSVGMGIGFRRLSIMDLSAAGSQPMHSPSKRYVLVFNGEVYNFRALRREIEWLGYGFRGNSDTEVVLAAIEAWGLSRALERFIGMFALALWDREERTLHLVRDRLGVKPLFLFRAPGTVLFASELSAFERFPGFPGVLNVDGLRDFLRYLTIPGPATIYEGARKVMPGEWIRIRGGDDLSISSTRYWSLQDVAQRGMANGLLTDPHEAADLLSACIEDAVRLRLEADVPVGALLSGGIDSSLVVAMMAAAGRKPRTFTIGFDVEEHDESRHARRIADFVGTDHTELRVTGKDALNVIPDAIGAFDEPFADPSQIPSMLVCRLARRDVTVVLAGDGGDEIFAGYNRHSVGARTIGRIAKFPIALRRICAHAMKRLPEGFWDPVLRATLSRTDHAWVRHPGRKLRKALDLLGEPTDAEMYRSMLSQWTGSEAPNEETDPVLEAMRSDPNRSLLARMLLADQVVYLPDDLLTKADRTSMAESLELRVPLLDHRVVELSWTLADDLKVRGREGKWILRKVLGRMIPPELWDRPKVGFSVPIAEWLRGPLRSWAEDHMQGSSLVARGILTEGDVDRAWRRVLAGGSHAALQIWAVCVGETWLRRRGM